MLHHAKTVMRATQRLNIEIFMLFFNKITKQTKPVYPR
ncbi:hypothetical protein GPLA_0043 [Paraglaciecola polaris LMG 21857]|uniref:Uncharacterized protein n=1 Tax=Paraglaciecola polaris LMG 21857 TaxID=1129793 RepID=K6YDZ3_9ALTE|nr:hypothetical protein GPLA_0043 [Paraglaciecola polaris LMG 21857]